MSILYPSVCHCIAKLCEEDDSHYRQIRPSFRRYEPARIKPN